jgi:hypothetical protein
MPKNRQNAATPEDLSYLVSRGGQADVIIKVPADWKLTFGAVNPGNPMSGRDLHCLRVWEGEKLRAVLCDVRSFRDLSIPLARKIERETGAASWTSDSAGNFERSESRQLEASFSIEGEIDTDDIPF